MRGCAVVCLLVLVVTPFAVASEPVVVYDNSIHHTSGNEGMATNGFLAFNDFVGTLEMSEAEIQEQIQAGNMELRPMGDEIILAGTERFITRFDMILFSVEPVTLDSLTLSLHAEHEYSDHLPAFPLVGPALWSGTLHDVFVNGLTTVTFHVPRVEVPDMFVWLACTDNLSMKAGLATYSPPDVGENPVIEDPHYPNPMDYYYLYEPGYFNSDWATYSLGGDPNADFGAKLWAVPEPATLSVLLLGGCLLHRRRRSA